MKVATSRWGEVTIKKQGVGKNNFDATKSFSILKTKNELDVDEFRDLFQKVVDLTEKYEYNILKRMFKKMGDEQI